MIKIIIEMLFIYLTLFLLCYLLLFILSIFGITIPVSPWILGFIAFFIYLNKQ